MVDVRVSWSPCGRRLPSRRGPQALGRADVTVTRLAAPTALKLRDPDAVRAASTQVRPAAAVQPSGVAASSSLSRMNATIADREVDPAEVRAWAKAQGLLVAARGRVPADLVARYRAATGR
jgi:hypothetical protein